MLVYFYSPTCGEPCEELDPVIEELAKKTMKKRHNIIFAKMNGAENEIEQFKVGIEETLLFNMFPLFSRFD